MPVVLVVEQDASYAQRIAAALSAMGHDVDLVADAESASQRAAMRAPQLVVVSGNIPGAESTLGRFSQRRGGPGSLVMAPLAQAGQVSAEQFQADLLLYKPFSEDDLRQAVGRLLSRSIATQAPPPPAPSAPAPAPPAAAPSAVEPSANPLTSADIFGDVLAEVEQEARKAESRGTRPPTTSPSAPPASSTPSAPPASSTPPASSPAPRPRARKSDIDRKLEETLSGVLPEKLRRADKAKPKRRPKPTEDDIDSLLDKTLSSLELPRKVRRQKAANPANVSPTQAQAPPAPASATPPAPQTPTPAAPPAMPSPPVSTPPVSTPPATPTAAPTAAAPQDRPMPEPQPTAPLAAPPTPAPTVVPPPPPGAPKVETPAQPAPGAPTPTFVPPSIPALDVEPTVDFELPPTEPAVPPITRQAFEPLPVEPPGAKPVADEPQPAEPSARAPSFEPPSFDQPSFDPPSFEPPAAEAAPEPAAPSFDLPSFEPPAIDVAAEPSIEPPAAFEAFDTAEASGVGTPEAEAPTGWSVTSFEDAATDEPAPSPFATELVPSIDPTPAPRSFSEDTFSDVEYPSDFAAAFAPAPESGEDTSGALDQVLEVRDAAAPQDEGTPFGDYRLLDRVAVGGMAEVWRARRRGVEGFQKTVAIKRILYHLTGNDDFVTMFIDEAKLAAQLHHAHIVQIYDLGKVEDDFFIAMEYVDGKDLRTILNQANSIGRRLPVRLALEIVIAVARALDYAHRKKDDNDRDLGLVHRDVSPQNVLIGYESEIKLCDFGIVKAVVKASTTQMGALKGKLQYMSPEQAWGRDVDSRSDIFSLGSVLFEVLTGERLFTGDSEIGVLDAVRDGKVRSPREIVPDLPAQVEDIALRALSNDPDQRYQTADDMVRDLSVVLDGLGPASTSLGEFLNELFPRASTAMARDTESRTDADDPAAPTAPEADTPPGAAPPTSTPAPKQGGDRARSILIAAIVVTALIAILVVVYFSLGDRDGTSPSNAAPAATAPPPATSAPAPAEPAAGDAPEATDPAASGAADPGRVQELIDAAVQDQRDQIEANYEARRQQLERELSEVQGDDGGGS